MCERAGRRYAPARAKPTDVVVGLPPVPGDVPVALRPAVPVELPVRPDLVDEVEVQVRHHQLVLVAAPDGQDLAVGIAEVRAAVELAEVPGRLAPHAV